MPKYVGKRKARYSPYVRRVRSRAQGRQIVAAAGARIVRAARRYIRRRRKYSKRKGSGVPLVMYGNLLRQRIRTILTYCDTKTLSAGSSSAHLWYVLNDIYDPQYALGGHQPAFHDKWALLYGSYRVTHASWTLTFYPRRNLNYHTGIHGTGTNIGAAEYITDGSHYDQHRFPAILGWEINNTDTARYLETADKNVLREVGSQSPKNHAYALTRYGKNMYVLKGRTSIANVLADPNSAEDATNFGTSPTKKAFLGIAALSKDGQTTIDWSVDIKIRFHAVLNKLAVPEQEN